MIPQKPADKHADKRRAIMDASLKLFCARCFQDTSTASISNEAGIATGTLFLYFESKEELVNELYLECKGDYATFMGQGVWEHTSFKARLKHIWERGTEWCLLNPEKIQFMVQFSSSPYITKLTKEKAMNSLNLMNEVLRKAIANKEVSTSSLELLSRTLNGYFHNARMFLLENSQNRNLKKWQEEIFDLIWKGIH
jgi:AcrR family transcriptional regulator